MSRINNACSYFNSLQLICVIKNIPFYDLFKENPLAALQYSIKQFFCRKILLKEFEIHIVM